MSAQSEKTPTSPVPASGETSSSSPSRKRDRKRSDMESENESSTSSTSLFSRRTKQKILEHNNGERCWHCGAGGAAPDVARVITKKDGSFSKYVARGLLTFDHLGDEQNGLPLCPSCHREFDDLNNPGLLFIPTHLDYFINFELEDYRNRLDVTRRLSHIPPRVVPTPQMYADYLKGCEIIPPEAKGGSYWRYTLRDFFPLHADKSFIPGLGPFKEPGLWCGAPMAALRRAFQVIGDPATTEGVSEAQLDQLWQLRKLYARRIPRTDLLPSHTSTASDQDAGHITTSDTEKAAQAPATASENAAPAQPIPTAFINDQTRRKRSRSSPGSSADGAAALEPSIETINREAKVPRLERFGRGSSTEINIERYLTMLKSPTR
ncbi:hypothetical protein HRR83_003777 [Exophiala dermatitidis]|uniref:HNH nuclease domain-containing protein n=1 Tax=Exophiala dermatitidis (strain ATCC 34100 / CBS 525.76 / NIH/UT8656) TaxID=858893 RepID=H6BPB4_EXODN|nr:uncharacterized protein HMPREF1120_01758 [Exophiala dermatitidis NIH/UT8656]KAJ4518923.1 hypothetical protein HRR75_002599 [Exophiala dermatitidis]EHY53569.1 hypothetical protein HMPREF1120_01758 [Exophiala dermatitidis NIH/UT8656]KAJ4522258.1 hypothetical protein HRR74_002841 [Exophiala dermatitidis]KAJ4529583.1 hypothetical protein HRR73_000609 [Exophiala dermatitidis]KAJ4543256.1 hypothetical protein HRR77_005510 [Exophiala dermatitidis]